MGGYQVIEGKAPIKAWTNGVSVEDQALAQIKAASQLPFVKGIAVMPDVHSGIGCCVGTVVATDGAIVPAFAGVDLGCGMAYNRTSLKLSNLPDNLAPTRSFIEAGTPHGRTANGGLGDRGAWGNIPDWITNDPEVMALKERLAVIVAKHPKIERAATRAFHQIGTLGTGNHFIELVEEKHTDTLGIMLHSGSRGIGNALASSSMDIAKKNMERWFIDLSSKDLAYLVEGQDDFEEYVRKVAWAQDYAMVNRRLMLKAVTASLKKSLGQDFTCGDTVVNCHHNYITKERHFGKSMWITRKGAVRAQEGDLGIIPGSMGARSYIVRGKGNRDSFNSCSHGAGRLMSRTEARRRFTLEDHAKATEGVECRKDIDVLDETPGAYKPIDLVLEAQSDLIEIVAELKQIICVKG